MRCGRRQAAHLLVDELRVDLSGELGEDLQRSRPPQDDRQVALDAELALEQRPHWREFLSDEVLPALVRRTQNEHNVVDEGAAPADFPVDPPPVAPIEPHIQRLGDTRSGVGLDNESYRALPAFAARPELR